MKHLKRRTLREELAWQTARDGMAEDRCAGEVGGSTRARARRCAAGKPTEATVENVSESFLIKQGCQRLVER